MGTGPGAHSVVMSSKFVNPSLASQDLGSRTQGRQPANGAGTRVRVTQGKQLHWVKTLLSNRDRWYFSAAFFKNTV
jgi:hypothetical protein